MSIVALKRKTNTKYSKISSNKFFSINNNRRTESHSNQHQTQTLMRGNAPRGHGSCCNNYPLVINKSQYNNYDPHIRVTEVGNQGISVKTNRASIDSRNKWMNRGYPHTVYKDTSIKDYSKYYDRIRGQSASINDGRNESNSKSCSVNCSSDVCNIKSKEKVSIVKRVDTLDHTEYLKTRYLNKHNLPTPNEKMSLPILNLQQNCITDINEKGMKQLTEKGNCSKINNCS